VVHRYNSRAMGSWYLYSVDADLPRERTQSGRVTCKWTCAYHIQPQAQWQIDARLPRPSPPQCRTRIVLRHL